MNKEAILKEFDDKFFDTEEDYKAGSYDLEEIKILKGDIFFDDLAEFISELLDQAKAEKEKARQDMVNGFIREFCNDHNEKIRWLRSIAVGEEHLLEKILDYFNSQVKEGKQ